MVKRSDGGPARKRAGGGGGPEGHIGYLLRQAQVTVRNAIERDLAEFGITVPQFSAMTVLEAYDRPSAADIARLTFLTPQTVNVIVRNLVRDGLVARTPDPVHGRILRLSLTERGKALLARCRARTDAIEARMTAGLTAAEEAVVRRWLAGLTERFGGGARPARGP